MQQILDRLDEENEKNDQGQGAIRVPVWAASEQFSDLRLVRRGRCRAGPGDAPAQARAHVGAVVVVLRAQESGIREKRAAGAGRVDGERI